MTNLSWNFLMDGYENEPSAEKTLFSVLDSAPFQAVHISAGAKAEQGLSIAKKTRARYKDMLVFFRKLPNDFQHLHFPNVAAWYESLAPWSDGGNLILPITNEPGVVDLVRQNAWYAAAIELMGRGGIRVTAPAMQTHNRFPAALLLDTWKALDKYSGFVDLHYYFDLGGESYSFPIDHIHKTIAAYCKPKGITTRFIISELGYLHRLDPHAGYRGGLGGGVDGATYAKQMIAEARAHPDLLYFIFGMGAQPPWLECDTGGDEDVIKPIVAYSKEQPTMPQPDYTAHDWGALIPKTTVNVTQTINRRDKPTEEPGGKPTGNKIGELANGEVVGYYDKPFQNIEYLWYKIVYNGVECYTAKVSGLTFTPYVEPPAPPVDPPAEETVEFKLAEVDAMIAANEQALAVLRGAKLPADGTKMLLDVPFVSQLGTDADSHNNDCLVADLLMCQRYLQKSKTGVEPDLPTVDMIVPVTPLAANPKALLTFSDGIALAKRLGFKVEYQSGMTPDKIRVALNLGQPVIALVDYAKYNPAGASIPHFMVINGFDSDTFITQDSYLKGANVRIHADALDAAMKTVPNNTGAHQALVLAA